MNLSTDRIRDIFEQHPLIKRVYDENVPKVASCFLIFLIRSYLKMISGLVFSCRDWRRNYQERRLRIKILSMILWTNICDRITIVITVLKFSLIAEINRKRSRQEETPNFINIERNEEHISKVSSVYHLFWLVERRQSTWSDHASKWRYSNYAYD